MKNNSFSICRETIQPGEQASLALPLPELFTCAPMYMPIKVVHGKKTGPCVLVIAAMHGNELNGTEIIHRLLASPALKKIKGTLIAVPVMNVYGFINKTRDLPGYAALQNNFPGSKNGSHAARLAYLFCSDIFSLADYCIDLQTGWMNYTNLPQIYASDDNEIELDLARVFRAPVVSEVLPEVGSLRSHANQLKTPYLVYESGEAMRFDEPSIRIGLKGIKNILQFLEMLPSKEKPLVESHQSLVTRDTRWIHAPTSGISYSHIKLGQQVKKGDLLATIKDPFGTGYDTNIKASFNGVVVSQNNLPLVSEGTALIELASYERLAQAVTQIEDWIDDVEKSAEH